MGIYVFIQKHGKAKCRLCGERIDIGYYTIMFRGIRFNNTEQYHRKCIVNMKVKCG